MCIIRNPWSVYFVIVAVIIGFMAGMTMAMVISIACELVLGIDEVMYWMPEFLFRPFCLIGGIGFGVAAWFLTTD